MPVMPTEKPLPEDPCLLKVEITKEKIHRTETTRLIVTLTSPDVSAGCHDTVELYTPSGLTPAGKDAEQEVTVREPEPFTREVWILEPRKAGRWDILVETSRGNKNEQREVRVTNYIGLPQNQTFLSAAAAILTSLVIPLALMDNRPLWWNSFARFLRRTFGRG
jgi:hypothetical protein